MSRSIVVFGSLVLLTFVVSMPTVPNDVEPQVVFNLLSAQQERIQLPSSGQSSEWQNIFGDRYAYETENTSDGKDLFSSNQLTVVPSAGDAVGAAIKYTIGKRVRKDRVVYYGVDGGKWSTPVNATFTSKYPSSGQGANVTFAEFFVAQSSHIGQVTVVDGGIGQRSITIVLQANNTLYFAYKALIYGIY